MADALNRDIGPLREALSRDRILLLAVAVFPLLTACFYARAGIGSRQNLQWWPPAGEPKIYGRLAKSRQDGIFSAGGLLGACGEKTSRKANATTSSPTNRRSAGRDFSIPLWIGFPAMPGSPGFSRPQRRPRA
jgi:hypothetical protein